MRGHITIYLPACQPAARERRRSGGGGGFVNSYHRGGREGGSSVGPLVLNHQFLPFTITVVPRSVGPHLHTARPSKSEPSPSHCFIHSITLSYSYFFVPLSKVAEMNEAPCSRSSSSSSSLWEESRVAVGESLAAVERAHCFTFPLAGSAGEAGQSKRVAQSARGLDIVTLLVWLLSTASALPRHLTDHLLFFFLLLILVVAVHLDLFVFLVLQLPSILAGGRGG